MSDQPDNNNFQRRNRQTRKDRIRAQKWFPSADQEPDFLEGEQANKNDPTDATEPDPVPFDFDSLPFAQDDAEAVEALSSLSTEVVQPPVLTPTEERFPPLPKRNQPLESLKASPPKKPHSAPPKRTAWGYNLLTLAMFLGMGGLLAWFAAIYQNPLSTLNPLPPPTPFVIITTTPLPQLVEISISPTPLQTAPIATPLPADALPFIVPEGLLYTPNANTNGCNWSSIAGSVVGLAGEPLNSYRVRVIGNGLDETVFTGAVQRFGAGGFELPVGDAPLETVFTVQLFNIDGIPVSEALTVPTSTSCEQNVVILNFVQGRAF